MPSSSAKALSDAIARDPDLEVVGTASKRPISIRQAASPPSRRHLVGHGDAGNERVGDNSGDPQGPSLYTIIMFSTLTERGAEATLDHWRSGDRLRHQAEQYGLGQMSEGIISELIPKIRSLCHISRSVQTPLAGASMPARKEQHVEIRTRPRLSLTVLPGIIAIGVSTGGPDAPQSFARFTRGIPSTDRYCPAYAPNLYHATCQRLATKCAVPVLECQPGALLEPGRIWIAPGDYHMVSGDGGVIRLYTHQGPRENFCRPSVDVLFSSVAEVFGAKSLGVILTGMGQDGLKGAKRSASEMRM